MAGHTVPPHKSIANSGLEGGQRTSYIMYRVWQTETMVGMSLDKRFPVCLFWRKKKKKEERKDTTKEYGCFTW